MAYIVKNTLYIDARVSIDGKRHQRANYLVGFGDREIMGVPCVEWTATRKNARRFETKSELNKYMKRICGKYEVVKVK